MRQPCASSPKEMETQPPLSAERVSNRILYIVSMNHAVNDGSVYLLSSLFPVVISLFSLSVFQVGILVGLGYLVSVIFQPVVGRYSEGRDPRKVLALGIAIISVAIASFVLATDFLTLLGSALLLRVGSSFFHPVGVSAVSKAYGGARLGHAMGFQSAFGNLGILLVFASSAPLYFLLGWKATFLAFALVGVVDVAVTLLIFGTLQWNAPHGRGSKGTNHLAKAHQGRLGIPFFFVATTFISGGSYSVILNFMNILLKNQNHLDVFLANVVVSAWIASAFFGAISTGTWSRARRPTLLLSLVYFATAASIFAFTFLSASLPLVITALLVNGFAISATYPLTYTELSRYLGLDATTRGRSFGTIFSAQTVGGSVLGLASGYLSDTLGLSFAFASLGVLALLAGGLTLSWERATITGKTDSRGATSVP
jgi:FSR family fosmidomycin resistance protein-like MFS transporter